MRTSPAFAAIAGRAARNVQVRILLIRVAGVFASFLVITMLARFAGAATVGEYGFAVVTATTVAYVCMLGLDQLVLRTIPADIAQGDTARARASARLFAQRIGLVSFVVAAIFLLSFSLVPTVEAGRYQSVLQATAALILLYPLLRFSHSLLRAIGLPIRAQIVESLSAILMALVIAAIVLLGQVPSAPFAVNAHVLVSAALLVVAALLYRFSVRHWSNATPVTRLPAFDAGFSFMLIMLVHASTEWLAYFFLLAGTNAEEVGVFRAVFQVAALLALVVQTGHHYIAPLIAADLGRGDKAAALRRYRQSRRVMILLAMVPAVVLLAVPGRFLLVAFGPEFEVGAPALAILVASQFVNVATGPVGTILAMAGRERLLLVIGIVGMAAMAALSWWLVPLFGLTGTAVALAVVTVWRNLMTYHYARDLLREDAMNASPPAIKSEDIPEARGADVKPLSVQKVAFFAIGPPRNPHTWSGTPLFALKEVESRFRVDVVDTPNLDFAVLKFLSLTRRIGFDPLREPLVHALYRRAVGPQVAASKPDLLFGVICSHKMIDLPADRPVVLLADALFASISRFYPNRAHPLPRTERLGNLLQQRMMDRASAIMFTSDWAAEDAAKHYHIPENTRIVVAPIGPNMRDDAGAEALASAKGRDGPHSLLFVGFDWYRKGGPDVLKLHSLLRAHFPEITLDIVGSNPTEAEGLPGVRVHGVPEERQPRRLPEAEVALCQCLGVHASQPPGSRCSRLCRSLILWLAFGRL
ncbi:MAG: polysaccharide biosynthesis C-terminal domain-containing protein [Polymorphobacter sp.]|uniref:polysaccharide biosynthesis C-terminal domain-containing protein n=1 Tax=Polymorphobacter sp. TaxID=1909290 RepID=UPI003A887306